MEAGLQRQAERREGSPARERWAVLALVVAIAGLGLALRWERLDYVEFTNDQAWPINRAYEFITTGVLPLTGFSSSVGTAHGPMEIYMLSLPVAISRDPRVATAFVGLLQVLAVIVTYALGSRCFGRAVGLIASFLYAVNPWAVHYARKLWTPDMTPLVGALFFLAIYGAVIDRSRRALALAFLLFAVAFLTHPSTVVYAPALVFAIALSWRWAGLRPLLLGGLLGLLAASPYLYNEWQYGFASVRGYFGVSTTAQASLDWEALKYVVTLASAQYFPWMTGIGFRADPSLPDLALANQTVTALLAVGLLVCLWRGLISPLARRQGGWEPYALLLLWFLSPIAVSARHNMELYPHYFLAVYSAQFLLVGIGVAALARLAVWALRRASPAPAWPVAAAGTALVLWFGLGQAAYFNSYLDAVEHRGPTSPYGVPLVYAERAAASIRELSGELGTENRYVYAYLQKQALDYLAGPDLPLRQVEPPEGILLPKADQGALAVLASDELGGPGRAYGLVREDGAAINRLRQLGFVELPERAVTAADGYVYYRFFHLPAGRSQAIVSSFTPVSAQPTLANGLRLLGYQLSQSAKPGDRASLALLWQLPQAPERYEWKEFNLFVHLVNAAGTTLGQQDKELFQYMSWRPEDRLITYHEVNVPPGTGPTIAWFDVGAYSRFDRQEVAWQASATGPAGAVFRLGSLKVAPLAASAPAEKAGWSFGDGLDLVSYSIKPSAPVAGGTLAVDLLWRARARPGGEYTVSVQVLDAAGELVAQQDSPPAGGTFPTSYWDQGDEVPDSHQIALPSGLKSGEYSLIAIAYGSGNGARLAVTAAGGVAPSDHAVLGKFVVGGN